MPWRDPRSIGRHGSGFAALRADLAAELLATARQAGLYFFISLLVAGDATADERPVPDEPEEQFTILVLTKEPDDAEAKVPLSQVTEEVAKRIKDRKKWFLVSNRRDRAELTVEVMNHTFEERMRTRMEYRVDVTGTNKELVDVTWNEEHHFIEARIHLPGGGQTLLRGADERERGGSLKGAASDLAEKLEALVKEQYWDLVARRVRSP